MVSFQTISTPRLEVVYINVDLCDSSIVIIFYYDPEKFG